MANSSDWIAQASEAPRAAPGWLAALSARDGFSPVSPFAQAQAAAASGPEPEGYGADFGEDLIAQAFAQGEAQGRAQAQAEAQAQLTAQRALRLSFRNLDQAALDALAADLGETVMALCAQVIEERAIDRDALTARCHKAAERIGEAASQCTLRLHPEDLTLIEDKEFCGHAIQPDPTLERGALVLEGPDGAVRDGPAEWRRAIAAALKA